MPELKILYYGDPVLKLRANQIHRIDKEIENLTGQMIDVMNEHDGVGLAAPQVGVSKRLIVVRLEEDDKLITLINPEITFRYGLQERDEGCLSLPGVSMPIRRAEKVHVSGTGLDGKPVDLEFEKLAARALQHEIDHIDGILITDRMTKKQLKEIEDQLTLIERGNIPTLTGRT